MSSLQLSLADGDDGYDTGSEVIREAFPALQAAIDTQDLSVALAQKYFDAAGGRQ